MLLIDLRKVVGPVPDVVGSEEREALFDVEHAGVGDATKIGLRDEVAGVGLREKLRQVWGDLGAVVAVEPFLRERVDGLLGAVDAEGELVDEGGREGVDQGGYGADRADLIVDR